MIQFNGHSVYDELTEMDLMPTRASAIGSRELKAVKVSRPRFFELKLQLPNALVLLAIRGLV